MLLPLRRVCRCLLFALLLGAPAALAASKPNVIMVLIDDMGWGDFSCFGNEVAKTPHHDQLAAEGIRFSQFYVNSPICSPSRTALTTGQYPQRWKITSFLNNRASNDERGVAHWLDPKGPTLPSLLKQEGYVTGHYGKWHLGGQRDVGEAPLIPEYGFDESLTNFEGLGPRLLPLGFAGEGKPPVRHALGSDKLGRGPVIWHDRSNVTAGYVGAAIAFIRKAVADDRPFYINLWPDDVHSPFFPPKGTRGDGSKRTLYHAVLEAMDAQLGALYEAVRADPKLRDNTVILVCSDNGPEPGAGSAGGFRGAKAMLYEGGVRSPLIVWAPGLMPPERAGYQNEGSVFAAMDLVPSILSITGTSAPEGIGFDGEDVAETLLGKSDAGRKAPIFWRRPPDRKTSRDGLLPDLAMRDGNWKLLCNYDGTAIQLYDLTKDRAEKTNVAAENVAVVLGLTPKLLAWHQLMPPDNGPSFSEEAEKPPQR